MPTGTRSERFSPQPASTTPPARSTRSTRCAATGSCGERSLRAGGCSAATPGATAASTGPRTRSSSTTLGGLESGSVDDPPAQHPHPDRRRPDLGARVAAHDDRPHLGVVDHRADDHGPGPARPADREADPLDAADAGAPAGDEGDPEALQERQAQAERGAHEVLPGEPDQPGLLMPPGHPADSDLLRALLRPAGLR